MYASTKPGFSINARLKSFIASSNFFKLKLMRPRLKYADQESSLIAIARLISSKAPKLSPLSIFALALPI